jgi:cellulose biosynthesis protein BcsQ
VSRFFNRIQDASRERPRLEDSRPAERSFRVLTLANNKGGIGKTTLAANLAVHIRALREDLPILVIGLDDQDTLDRVFAVDRKRRPDVLNGLRAGSFEGVVCEGRYGIHYVPSCQDVGPAKRLVSELFDLQAMLDRTAWRGLVILDTKSDFEILTQNALVASDLVLVVVKDRASLHQSEKLFQLLSETGRPRESAAVLLSMVDRRIRLDGPAGEDVLGMLVGEIRRRGHPLLESFVSHSPKIAALESDPSDVLLPVAVGARRSVIHRQLLHAASDVLKLLDQTGLPGSETSRA